MGRFFLVLATALLALFLTGMLGPHSPEAAPVSRALDTALVEPASFEVRVQVVGELQPVNAVTVFSQIKSDRGTIIHLIEDGSQVDTGDVLVSFDPTQFQEEARRAELELDLAASALAAREQALEWERVQAERRERSAEYELEVAELEQERLALGDGPLELARLEGDLAEKQGEWDEDAGFLGELEQLSTEGHVSTAEVEQIRKRAEKAQRVVELARKQLETYRDFILPSNEAAHRNKVERARQEVEQVRRSSEHKLAEVQASVQQAERDLAAARAYLNETRTELERTVLRAPQAGMVVLMTEYRGGERRKPRVGDSVWQNQPLLYLPDLSRMEVVTKVREIDVHKIAVGSEAVVTLEAYPDLALGGSVRSIGVLAERAAGARGGDKSFQLFVDLESGDERLRPGMTARVDILSVSVEQALVVPIQAVWQTEGATWTWLVTSEGHEQRAIELGPRDKHRAVVVSGLEAGDRVSLVDPHAE